MPEWKAEIRRRLAPLRLAPTREQAIVEELAQDLDDCYADWLARGATPAEAYQHTLAELSEHELLARELARVERYTEPILLGTNRRTNMIADLWQDLRFGVRMLVKQPGLTLIAMATLALGIGANTAIFSVVNGVLLRPLPFVEPERLVGVWEDPGNILRNSVNPRNYADWREQMRSFEQTAAFYTNSVNLTGSGEPERIATAFVSVSFFPTLRASAVQGRVFLPEEEQAGKEQVAIISDGLRQRRFGAQPDVIGRTLTLDGTPYTVVGVMPAGFQYPRTAELWAPLVFSERMLANDNRGSHFLTTFARLKPGVGIAQAQAEMDGFYAGLRQQYPGQLTGWTVHVFSMMDDAVGDVRRMLWVLLGAVGFVLLIACANVASLTLARATTREREIAVRAALGASRVRLLRQLLTESVLLVLIGGGLGALVGWLGVDWLVGLRLENIPRLDEVRVDGRAIGFTALVSLVSGVLFGLAPAWNASRVRLNESLKEAGAKLSGSGRSHRLRRVFVVTQVALSLLLLTGAGLMIRSLVRLQQVNPGFDAANVLTMRVALPEARYADAATRIAFFRQSLDGVRKLPGVQAAAFISDPPISGQVGLWRNRFDVEGRPSLPPGQRQSAYLRWISPDYFRTLNAPLLKGRMLTEADATDRPFVVVIDEAMARRYFPNEDPLGKRLVIYSGGRMPREIVGVVGNIRQTALDQDADPHMYVPYFQTPQSYGALLVRTAVEPRSLTNAVRSAVAAADREQAVYGVRTMEEVLAESVATRRFSMWLLGGFAAVALVLAALGIYGVLSYTVNQRTQEIGVRMALGATGGDVLRLVVGQAMRLVALGVVIGLCGAVALTRVMKSLLFGVSATDPPTFAGVALLLATIALFACWLPARCAARVDPLIALRHE